MNELGVIPLKPALSLKKVAAACRLFIVHLSAVVCTQIFFSFEVIQFR
jgi:hypothetical protein